jgi:radical SAM superfamily enzyme YgiQ (UPF0313 family)
MRLLLVAPRDGFFPIGLSYIAAALREGGHELECRYQDDTDLSRLMQGDWDFVGFGGMCRHYPALKQVADAARAAGRRTIVGGNIVTSEPELMCRALGADFAVLGQGEETVVELLRCVEQGGDLAAVDGIGYVQDGRFVQTNARRPARSLDALPWPDYESFGLRQRLDQADPHEPPGWNDVFDDPREYIIVAGRSCPFRCTFCYHPAGEKYRQRSVSDLMAELRSVVPRYGINIVNIIDDLFASTTKRVVDFCQQFKQFVGELSWDVQWRCLLRVDLAKPELLAVMKDAGCFNIGLGFESYSPVVLNSMKKKISPQQIHDALHATQDQRITVEGNFIFGDPAETLETAKETLDFWHEHSDCINIAHLRVYPDSPLYRQAIKDGLITDRLDYLSGHLSDLINLTSMPVEDYYRLAAMMSDAVMGLTRYRPERYGRGHATIRCPYCQTAVDYPNFTRDWADVPYVHCRHCRRRIALDNLWRSWHRSPSRVLLALRQALARRGWRPSQRRLELILGLERGGRRPWLGWVCRLGSRLVRRFVGLPTVYASRGS